MISKIDSIRGQAQDFHKNQPFGKSQQFQSQSS